MSGPWERYGAPADSEDGPWKYFGGAQPPEAKAGVIRRIAGDIVGVPLAQGVVGVPEAAVGVADILTGGRAGKAAEDLGFRPREAKQIIGDALYSEEQKRANEAVSSADGFIPTVQAALENPSVIARTAVESIPSMGAGGVIGRLAGKAAPALSGVARGAIGEGVTAAGQNAEQVRQEDPSGLLTPGQSGILAASGAVTGAISRFSGGLAQRLGIGDIETMAAGGGLPAKTATQAGGKAAEKGIARKAAEGFITEGMLEELPQSWQEQVAQNLAQGKPWNEGAGQAAALGLLSGGLTGAAVGPLEGGEHQPQQPPAPAPKPMLLTNQPDPLIGFADGTVARRSEVDAYLASLPAAERSAASERMFGVPPGSYRSTSYQPPAPPAGPISRAAAVAPPPETLPQPEGETKDGKGEAKPAGTETPPAMPLDPNAGPISRAAAIAQQVANPPQSPQTSPQGQPTIGPRGTPEEQQPAQAAGYAPQPGDIVVDDHFAAAHSGATSDLNDRKQPTDAQKESENYATGKTRVAGMTVSIENGQGTTRSGIDGDGNPWEILMRDHYGRLLGTIGADSKPGKVQHLDVFIKTGTPKNWAGDPVVVDTKDPATGKFDEHKIVFGADSVADARAVFARNYNDGQARILSATAIPQAPFKAWAYDRTQKSKPFAEEFPELAAQQPPSPVQQSAGRAKAQADLQAALGDLGELMGVPARGPAVAAPGATAAPAVQQQHQPTPQEQRIERRQQQQRRGSAGMRAARSAAYDKNPLMTFLATHGLYHAKGDSRSLKSEFSPDAHVSVPGYHVSVFRRDGKLLDALVQPAIEEGYLPQGADESDLYELVAAAFRGDRIVPVFAEGVAQQEMERRQADREEQARAEAEAASSLADFDDDLLVELAHNLDDVPSLDAQSNTASAMRALGFSEEEITNATETAHRPEQAPADGAGDQRAGQAAQGQAAGAGAGRAPEAGPEAAGAQGEVEPVAAAPSQGAGTAASPDAAAAAQSKAEQAPEAPPAGGKAPPASAAPDAPAPKSSPEPQGEAKQLPPDRERVLQTLQPDQHGGKLSAARIGGILGNPAKPGTSIGTAAAQQILDELVADGLVRKTGRSYELTPPAVATDVAQPEEHEKADDDEDSRTGAPRWNENGIAIGKPTETLQWKGTSGDHVRIELFNMPEGWTAGLDTHVGGVSTGGGGGGHGASRDRVEPSREASLARVGREVSDSMQARVDNKHGQFAEPVRKAARKVLAWLKTVMPANGTPTADTVVNGRERGADVAPEESLLLMPCSEGKLPQGGKASDIYQGVMWQTLRKHAPAQMPHMVILSAKHGFIGADEKIDAYEQKMDADRADIYARQVGNAARNNAALQPRAGPFRDVQIVGGEQYRSVMRALVAQMVSQGKVAPDASIRETTGRGIGDHRAQLGAYLDGFKAAVAAPAATTRSTTNMQRDEAAAGGKPAGVATRKSKQTKAEREHEAHLDRLAAFFTPGNIVPSYGGHDRVIEFIPMDSRGSWSVRVHAVVKQGDTWVDDPKDNRDRQHSTMPSERELKAGPTVPAQAAAPAPDLELSDPAERAGAFPFNADQWEYTAAAPTNSEREAAAAALKPGMFVQPSYGHGARLRLLRVERDEPGEFDGERPVGTRITYQRVDKPTGHPSSQNVFLRNGKVFSEDTEDNALNATEEEQHPRIYVMQRAWTDEESTAAAHRLARARGEATDAGELLQAFGLSAEGADRLNPDLAEIALREFNSYVDDFVDENAQLRDYIGPDAVEAEDLDADLRATINLANRMAQSLRELIDGQLAIEQGKGSNKALEAAQNHLKKILGGRVAGMFELQREGGAALTPEALQPLIDKWQATRDAEDAAQKKIKPEKRTYRTNPNVLLYLQGALKLLREGKVDEAREELGSMVGMGKGKGNWAGTIDTELRALLHSHDRAQKPAAAAPAAGPQDLLGAAPNASQQAAAKLQAEKAQREQSQRQAAPDGGDLTLTGSDRPVDVGAAHGQGDLLAAPAAIPEGLKPFGEPYYSGPKRDQLVQGYAKFAQGERVQQGEHGPIGTVTMAFGSGPVFTKLFVQFPLGEIAVPVSELRAAPQEQAAPTQWKVGDFAQLTDRTTGTTIKVRIEKLTDLDGVTMATYSEPEKPAMGQSFAPVAELQPLDGEPPQPPAPKGRGGSAVQKTRDAARDSMRAAAARARADGLTNLADRLDFLSGKVAISDASAAGSRTVAPAHADKIVAKYEQLAERARQNPADTFADVTQESTGKRAPSADTLRAKADLNNALADLGDLLSKKGRASIVPEDEAKLVPILTRVMDAAFRLGYHSFKDAAKYALDTIRGALGSDVAEALTLQHLQGSYIAMSGGKTGADGIMDVAGVTRADIEAHTAQSQEDEDASGSDSDLEPDSGQPAAVPPAAPGLRGEGPAGAQPAAGAAGTGGRGGAGRRQGATGVPDGGPVAGGERVNIRVDGGGGQVGPASGDPRADLDDRGTSPGASGVQPEPAAGARPAEGPRAVPDEAQRRRAQRAADGLSVTPGDRANIDATLPYLLPAQREDVLKAEQQHGKPEGYGMLFTNGTGTGKTFTGLGVVKRRDMRAAGKSRQLIVVPDNKIAADWIDSAKALNLTVTQLESTKDTGSGIVITTYANLGENDELASVKWDHVLPDEAHSLMQSADGDLTGYLANLRAITYHPEGQHTAWMMRHREQHEELASLSKAIEGNSRIINNPDTMEQMVAALRAENDRLQVRADVISRDLGAKREAIRREWAANTGATRTRATFLSATPFAYHTSLEWAQGYLFDYAEGYPYDVNGSRPYNQPGPREHFFMTHLGYRMRFNKLTKPEATVDVAMLERQLNSWMKKKGSLSGRMLEVDPDYDRRFVAIDSAIGNKIDESLDYLRERMNEEYQANKELEPEQQTRGWGALDNAIRDQFDYLSRRYLLEAIKTKEAIPIVRAHMALGRRVVVFHDYKKGSGINPFDVDAAQLLPLSKFEKHDDPQAEYDQHKRQVEAFNAARAQFRTAFPQLFTELVQLKPPVEAFREAFEEGRELLVINGDEKQKALLARYAQFQNDEGGPLVALVQSDKNKGWSGHDTTGKFQRALLNLGLPTAPTKLIQLEGRIYRTGVVSNAIMRSLNTGTNWERWAFAQTIASRASTAENLGMGELSRALRDSIIASFENADRFPPGHEGEGTGGKAMDRASNAVLTDFDRAKTFYWATQKKTSRNKAEEGKDYFATPEPLGLKMVQWADIRAGEDALEPSAGHGAISRWMPDLSKRTVIEPAPALRSRLAMAMDPAKDRIIDGTFEDHDSAANKYDAIVMNPPFGVGGKQALGHVAKAVRHLRDGGRIVALIPSGPAADKRLEQFLYGKETRPAKPLGHTQRVGDYYAGDTVTLDGQSGQFVIDSVSDRGLMLRAPGQNYTVAWRSHYLASIVKAGPRTVQFSPSDGLQLVADIALPQVTFERAGTQVASHVIVLEKTAENVGSTRRIDLTGAGDINALFDRIEDLDVRPRAKPAQEQQEAAQPASKPAAKPEVAPAVERGSEPLVEHVTQKGKTLRGIVRMGLTLEQARALDPYTFKKDGGYFIREAHLKPPTANEPPPAYPTPYETDLFGNALPQAPVRKKPEAPAGKRTVIRQQALDLEGPAVEAPASVQPPAATEPQAELSVDTFLHKAYDRELGTGTVRNPAEAAVASRYLARSAVERVDALVTNKAGRVLAVVGHFKGDRAQSSAHPFTVLSEALQVDGATDVWLSHNHPSGKAVLSMSDMNLERVFAKAFEHTGIAVRGILAVTPSTYAFASSSTDEATRSEEPIPDVPGAAPTTVPVYERHLVEGSSSGPAVSSPSQARAVAKAAYDRSGPGIMLLDAQNEVSGWIPLGMRLLQRLTTGDALRQLLTTVTRSNASTAILVHGGEAERTVAGLPNMPKVWRNIVNAVAKADVRVLDVVDVKANTSLAESGANLSGGGELYALAEGGTRRSDQPGQRMSIDEVRQKLAEFRGMSVEQAQGDVDDLTRNWKGGIEVRVVATPRDLPGGGLPGSRGMYSHGVGYIVASAHKDRVAVGRTLAHEIIQHHGMRATLGEANWRRLMLQIQAAANAGNPEVAAAREWVRLVYRRADGSYMLNEGGTLEADEIAARLIERSVDEQGNMRPRLQWLKWTWAKVSEFLRSVGLHIPFTLAELHGVWVDARRGIESGRIGTPEAAPTMPGMLDERQHALSDDQLVGDTGRNYTPEQERAMRNVGWVKDPVPLKERMRHLWQNAGKILAQGLVDQFAPIKDLSREAYGLLRLSKGSSGAFEVLLQGGQLKLVDGAYDFDASKRGGVVERLLVPLQGEHHDFFRWVAANRAQQLMSEDRERLFTADDIRALKTLADGQLDFDFTLQHGPRAGQTTRNRAEAYADSLVTFNQFNKNTLDMAEQSGLIDADSRALWEKEFYVPFYRVADEGDGGIRGMNIKSGVVRQQAFKQLKGGSQQLNADLLENTLLNWAHLLDAAAKNRAARATLDALVNLGSAIEAREQDVRQMGRSIGKRNNVVWAMDAGRRRHFLIDDPYLLSAVSALEFAGFRSPVMKAMGAFKHALTLGVTASPFFKVRNLIRDSIQAVGTAPLSANLAGNIRQGWAATRQGSDSHFRLLAGGGTIHFGTMMEGSEAKRVQALVEAGVDRATILDTGDKVKAFYRKTVEPLITAYNELGNRGEAINRAALYEQLRRQGVSHAEASLQARDLMDFSMQGSFNTVRFLTQVVPFMNARMQGLYKLGRAAKEDPARFAAVLGATAMLSIGLMLAYRDDDDWKKREDWDRNNYWWFKAGGLAYRIPKPFEVGAIATLAERSWEAMVDPEMTGERYRDQLVALMGDNLSMNPLPQIVKPVLDVYANKDSFTGRPVETLGMEKLQPQYRYRQDTSMAARGASTALNAAARTVGASAPSPVQIDHLVRGYFGWLGSMIVSAGDTIARPVTGQPDRPQPDYWKVITGAMAANLEDAPSRYVSTTYQQARELEQAYGTWRHLVRDGKMAEAQAFRDEFAQELVRYRQVEAVRRAETRLNQLRHQVEQGSGTPEEKRLRIRELDHQADQIARRLAPTS